MMKAPPLRSCAGREPTHFPSLSFPLPSPPLLSFRLEPPFPVVSRAFAPDLPGGQDERMLDLMGFMDAPSLGRLASVSRALYVFAHVEELWKGLVVQVLYIRMYVFFMSRLLLTACSVCVSVISLRATRGRKDSSRQRLVAEQLGALSEEWGLNYRSFTQHSSGARIQT